MNKYKLLLLLVFVINNITKSYCQHKPKSDTYLYFKEDTLRQILKQRNFTTDRNNHKYGYDVYVFKINTRTGNKDHLYAYTPLDSNKYIYVNKKFIQSSIKTIDELDKIEAFGYDTTDQRRFPFKRVFIVEFISNNKYKVIQVNSFINSNYY